jgi:hypothetical protein
MPKSRSVLVEIEGVLLLPESLCEELGLQPGDLLSVQGSPPLYFTLEPYRNLLTAAMLNPEAIQILALQFLARPLAAVDEAHRVYLPPEVFPLPADSQLTVFADSGETGRVQVFVGI